MIFQNKKIRTEICWREHKPLHITTNNGKGGCRNDQIQVNLCPTYDICLDSLLYIV